MSLEQELRVFQRRYLETNHLHRFFRIRPFTIRFYGDQDVFTFTISDDRFEVADTDANADVSIQANNESLQKLLQGECRLQELKKAELVTIRGSYTAILKAETLLYLNQSGTSENYQQTF